MKPCRGCGGEKPPGRAHLCDDCRERRLSLSMRAEKKRQENKAAVRVAAPEKKSYPAGQSWCKSCSTMLPMKDFSRASKSTCRVCLSNKRFTQNLATKFGGMTTEQYDTLFRRQGGVCAICGTAPRSRRLAVDHDHGNGKVRGLLCKRCNHHLLGGAHDSIELLRKAIDYLTRPPANTAFRTVPLGALAKKRRRGTGNR